MATEDMLKSSEFERGYYETEVGKEELKQNKIEELKKLKMEKQKELLKKKKVLKKAIKKLKKKKKISIKRSQLEGAMRGRARLLREVIQKKKRPVNILAKVEDKIPSMFIR